MRWRGRRGPHRVDLVIFSFQRGISASTLRAAAIVAGFPREASDPSDLSDHPDAYVCLELGAWFESTN